ncbi:hypothetical protein EJB05_40298, partial [Eragrostis curvula]
MVLGVVLLIATTVAAVSENDNTAYIDLPSSSVDEVQQQQQQVNCPQLGDVVRSHVQAAFGADRLVTAGLLRIFFHDCFPQGCDASILLGNEFVGERRKNARETIANQGLQDGALQLIERIRQKVHEDSRCRASVSCADILALATRDAVNLAGGPKYEVPLGRRDSMGPAQDWQIGLLPKPFDSVGTQINSFRNRGFNENDLVALSGAHTVGHARCGAFSDRTNNPGNDGFAWHLKNMCAANKDWKQQLDGTPANFDNRYFNDLREKRGVLTSDVELAKDDSPVKWLVDGFARDENWFKWQFGESMKKLGNLNWRTQNVDGEIRTRSCFTTNSGSFFTTTHVDDLNTPTDDDDDEGLLAAAA